MSFTYRSPRLHIIHLTTCDSPLSSASGAGITFTEAFPNIPSIRPYDNSSHGPCSVCSPVSPKGWNAFTRAFGEYSWIVLESLPLAAGKRTWLLFSRRGLLCGAELQGHFREPSGGRSFPQDTRRQRPEGRTSIGFTCCAEPLCDVDHSGILEYNHI